MFKPEDIKVFLETADKEESNRRIIKRFIGDWIRINKPKARSYDDDEWPRAIKNTKLFEQIIESMRKFPFIHKS